MIPLRRDAAARRPRDPSPILLASLAAGLGLLFAWPAARGGSQGSRAARRVDWTPRPPDGNSLPPGAPSSSLPLPPSASLDEDSASYDGVMSFLERAARGAPAAKDFAGEFLKDPELSRAWEDFKAEARQGKAAAPAALVRKAAESAKFRELVARFAGEPGFRGVVAEVAKHPLVAPLLNSGGGLAQGPSAASRPAARTPSSGRPSTEVRSLPGLARAGGTPVSGAQAGSQSAPGGAVVAEASFALEAGGGPVSAGDAAPAKQAGAGTGDATGLAGVPNAAPRASQGGNSILTSVPAEDQQALFAAYEGGDPLEACERAGRGELCRDALAACRRDANCVLPGGSSGGDLFWREAAGTRCVRERCRRSTGECSRENIAAGADPYGQCDDGTTCNGRGGCSRRPGAAAPTRGAAEPEGPVGGPERDSAECAPGGRCACRGRDCAR